MGIYVPIGPQSEALLKSWGEPLGRSINGNLGQTLLPGNISLSGKSSTNSNIQIIINGKGSINHQAIGVAHEFGHSAGLGHMKEPKDNNNLMMQAMHIKYNGGRVSLARNLSFNQLKEMQQNYLDGRLNRNSPIRTHVLKKYLIK